MANRNRTAAQAVALLRDPEFRVDHERILTERATGTVPDVKAFIEPWGVFLPRDSALVKPESPCEAATALLSGRWGLFPCSRPRPRTMSGKRLGRYVRRLAQRIATPMGTGVVSSQRGCDGAVSPQQK